MKKKMFDHNRPRPRSNFKGTCPRKSRKIFSPVSEKKHPQVRNVSHMNNNVIVKNENTLNEIG